MKPLSPETAAALRPVPLHPTDRMHLDTTEDLKSFKATFRGEGRYLSAEARKWLQRLPERKQLSGALPGQELWQIAATDVTSALIAASWKPEQLSFEPSAEVLLSYLRTTSARLDLNAEQYATFKALGAIPDELDGAVHPELPLTRYQRAAAWIAYGSEGYALFFEQGAGKTPTTISVVSKMAIDRPDDMIRVLVVCPKGLRHNWATEIGRFSTMPGKSTIMRGQLLNRVGQLITAFAPEPDARVSYVIASYEAAVRTADEIRALPWDLIVLDEGHNIKTPNIKRTRAMLSLRDAASKRMLLTGTPVTNTPLDLYAQLEFLGQGWSGFRSWEAFKDFYGVFVETESGFKKLVSIQNKPFMQERLARTSFIITKKEALPELPDKVYDTYGVDMSGPQADAYARVAEKLLLEIEDDLGHETAMTINNVLTKLLRLAQICSGYVVPDREVDVEADTSRARELRWFDENPKLEALVEMLKEKGPHQKTLVWCCFVPDIKRIMDRLAAEGVKAVAYYGSVKEDAREDAVHAFNADPEVKVLVGNPAAGGVGLNLVGYPYWDGEQSPVETNCDHEVFYSQDWSMSKRAQAEDRPHRKGTRTNVRITDLIVPDTIDEEIRLRVLLKKRTALEISDIREIITEVLRGLAEKGRDDE
jgi:SNF2 family DNA or RNA helicase